MNQLSLNVGQSLAAFCVLFALVRGISDASLAQSPEWAFHKNIIEASKLEGKLAAMRQSTDTVLRRELVAKIAKLYADAGMFSKAEPFALVNLAAAREKGGVEYAQALIEAGSFYRNWRDLSKSQYLNAEALKTLEANNDADARCKAYLAMATDARAEAEIASGQKGRDHSFVVAEEWLGKAVDVARHDNLKADTQWLKGAKTKLCSACRGHESSLSPGETILL